MNVNTVSLLGATVATNLLGLAFWGLASRLRSPAEVGQAAAIVSALLVLSTVAQLNLGNVFIRFVPVAGRDARRLVARGYAAVAALAVLAGAVYAFSGLGDAVLHSPAGRILFVACVVLFALFALQDAVLVSLRLAWWVPIENVTFAALKLALLPLLVVLPLGAGIVAAWAIPVALAIAAVSALLFRSVLSREAARHAEDGALPAPRRLASFVAAEYVGTLCMTATMQAMPLLVLWRLGAVQNAYFTLPWLVWLGIALLLSNVAATFVVEAISVPDRAHVALRQGLRLWLAVTGAAVVGCCVVAPLFLRVLGPGYAEHGTAFLRLVGAATPFALVTFVYSAFAWLDQRVWRLAAIQAASGAGLVVLAVVLLPRAGLAAVGWANLAVQVTCAALMAPAVWARVAAWRAPAVRLPAGSPS